ncbi:MAG: hypothetical protein M5R40_25460 [Anaerolineae bacterium]|nr:hypothetical protein [Anaerolineae bacterium]
MSEHAGAVEPVAFTAQRALRQRAQRPDRVQVHDGDNRLARRAVVPLRQDEVASRRARLNRDRRAEVAAQAGHVAAEPVQRGLVA